MAGLGALKSVLLGFPVGILDCFVVFLGKKKKKAENIDSKENVDLNHAEVRV